jgi:CRP/FNR family transcriptional regulator, cyclic AMP receptor protein
MPPSKQPTLGLRAALDDSGTPFTVATYQPKEVVFFQGDPSDSVLYIETGSVRLTVLASNGKEATIGLMGAGAFLGEEALTGVTERQETATALADTTLIEIATPEMMRRLGTQQALSKRFIGHILARNLRLEADLVDQLFNSCEKRLARTLLLLADSAQAQPPLGLPISQQVIAEMVGTTRSRVNLFMNKFKRLGFIEYENGLKISPSLMTVVVHD